jgi:hypothetical protein
LVARLGIATNMEIKTDGGRVADRPKLRMFWEDAIAALVGLPVGKIA